MIEYTQNISFCLLLGIVIILFQFLLQSQATRTKKKKISFRYGDENAGQKK